MPPEMSRVRQPMPGVGPPARVSLPPIARGALANGLGVWTLPVARLPIVTAQLVIGVGSADDPAERPGLAGVVADMLDEAAGGRDAIALAEAFSALGAAVWVDTGPDVTTVSCTVLTRHLEPALALLGDLVFRPHLDARDLVRVTELRRSRLQQLRRTASAVADRAFLAAVFGSHPYGHGVLGTTPALETVSIDEVRAFHASRFVARAATLIVGGDAPAGDDERAARAAFGGWTPGTAARPALERPGAPAAPPPVIMIERPGAPQSELRIGHAAPPRATGAYHAIVTLNAVLGGHFSSRLNRNLRETRALTYGVRTGFDLRRAGGTFACETSVQADGTALAVAEVLREFADIRAERTGGTIGAEELDRAKAGLTRGYARSFETADQVVRAATLLVTCGLADDTFERFVPEVEALTAADITAAAREHVRPDDCAIVVVGDGTVRTTLESLGRPVVTTHPDF